MSLRLKLFLLFGGLVASVVLAQWWWVRAMTRDLSSEIDAVASSVGHSVVDFFNRTEPLIECLDGGDDCEDVEITRDNVVIKQYGRHGQGGEVRRTVAYAYRVEHPAAGEPAAGEPAAGEPAAGEPAEEPGAAAPGATAGQEHVRSIGHDAHIKLHIEHKDDARYLFVGGPDRMHRVRIPLGFRDRLESMSRRMMLGSAGFLALGLTLAAALAHGVTTPLRRLSDAARRLGGGALGTRVEVPASGEVGEAVAAFNHMSGRLEELDRRHRELSARQHLGEIGEISRGLAHTLRNPLNALGLSVEELAAGAGEGAGELAESARRQIRRIDSSLKSFLALASQSGGVLTQVDLGELVEDVALEALQDGRGKARLELEPAGELPSLEGSRPELRAVLQALVVNAVEASPEGGKVTVRVTAPATGRWRVEIEDQGPGLPAAVRERLFTPHLSTKANGSGMGLFLAHRIATGRYGGSLELRDLEDDDGVVRGTRAVLEIGERIAADEGAPRKAGDV